MRARLVLTTTEQSSPGNSLERPRTHVETVLVLEDDDSFRASAVLVLERLGYSVVSARDPEGALRAVLDAPIDLVLTNVELPLMNGPDLSHTIAALRPGTHFIFMSSLSEKELGELYGLSTSSVDYLAKPFGAVELGRLAASVLGNERGWAGGRGRNRETVLVVDDNQLVLTSTRKLLATAGYQVFTAATPAQALELFTTYRSRIDLILLDILLPLMSGFALASKISEIRANMRILYMSSCVDRRALEPVTPRQLIDFIEKPFQAGDLIRKTRGILAKPLPGCGQA